MPILITLLAMVLHLYGLSSKSLWFDELSTLTNAGWGGSWWEAVRNPLTIPTTPKPPLSFVITRLFLALGDRVFLLRLQAAFFATMTIPLTYTVGRRLFDWDIRGSRSEQIGLIGAFLLAIAPLYVRYAQEARMYALWTFLSLLSLYLFWRALRSTKARWWAAFAIATVMALYTHLFAVLTLGVLVLFALWLLVRRQSRARFPFRVRHFLLIMAGIILAYIPMLPFLAEGLLSFEGLGGEPVQIWSLVALLDAVRLFSAGSNVGLTVYALLVIVALVSLAIRGRELLVLAALWIVLPAAGVMLTPFSHAVRVRYFLFALPVYLLLVAYGLAQILTWISGQIDRRRHPDGYSQAKQLATVGALALLALFAALAAISAVRLVGYYGESKQNWRDATWLVNMLAEPGDIALVRHIYHQKGVLFYAKQFPAGANGWSEANVQVFPSDLTQVFPPRDHAHDRARGQGTRWLIVPHKDTFVPGGTLDNQIRPDYALDTPIIFDAPHVPKEAGVISPTSFRKLAVVRAAPPQIPSMHFWTESEQLEYGDCTWLRWATERVGAVYLEGEGVVGHGKRLICPRHPTSYELEVILLDGTIVRLPATVEVKPP